MSKQTQSSRPELLPIEDVPIRSFYDEMAIAAVYIGHFLNVLNAQDKYAKDCPRLRMSSEKLNICLNLTGCFYDHLRCTQPDVDDHLEAARWAFGIVYHATPALFSWKHLTSSCRALHSFATEAGYVL